MIEVSYSDARARLAELLDRVADDREVVRIRRQGGKPAAVLLDADEYASLEETAYLLSSPANARRLLRAVLELDAGAGQTYASVDDLWRDLDRDASVSATSSPPRASGVGPSGPRASSPSVRRRRRRTAPSPS